MRLITYSFVTLFLCACSSTQSNSDDSIERFLNPRRTGETVEVLLIGDKFQNTQGDKTYLYDATIYIVVAKEDVGYIESQIEDRMGRISQSVTEIFAKSSAKTLQEPGQIKFKHDLSNIFPEHFGTKKDASSYVRSIIISNWKRFSTDL